MLSFNKSIKNLVNILLIFLLIFKKCSRIFLQNIILLFVHCYQITFPVLFCTAQLIKNSSEVKLELVDSTHILQQYQSRKSIHVALNSFKKMNVIKIPKENYNYDNMQFSFSKVESTSEVRYKLVITSYKKSTEEIHDFIQKCHNDYIFTREKLINDSDKILTYVMRNYQMNNQKIYNPIYWKKYSSNMNDFINFNSFDKLFFPEKNILINAINDLNNEKIPKLTILLYGHPGKTLT